VRSRISEGGRTADGTGPFREGREQRNLPDAYPKTSALKNRLPPGRCAVSEPLREAAMLARVVMPTIRRGDVSDLTMLPVSG
jgi:hypothetical protein